ncbi:uncharacterized protein LOC130903742 [Diorhabda carinulata]|uniref:uncharacterized protein LOC130903742 n=1 Tax=Diorhabda carinulata TaxID=1163345 RepID=UPI0025A1A2A8|nr:uncharacterized protein LOC130903742 [Diorhabda carinulata]
MSYISDPPPKEPTLEQHMIEFGKVTAASIKSCIDPNRKYLILQGNKIAQIFIKNAFEFFEKHFPNKNPHTLTARCLQINVTAVRKFKKGPTEKSISQKPYGRKSKSENEVKKETKKKSDTGSKKSGEKMVKQGGILPPPTHSTQNLNYQSNETTVQEQPSFVSQGNREFSSLQVPMFSITSQNNIYSYSSKHANYIVQKQISSQETMNTLSKPSIPDIFHLSPEPQYGAPSVAVATNINQKNNLQHLSQNPNNFIKQFNTEQEGYRYQSADVPDNGSHTKDVDCLQKQYNFGNLQTNQNSYKY